MIRRLSGLLVVVSLSLGGSVSATTTGSLTTQKSVTSGVQFQYSSLSSSTTLPWEEEDDLMWCGDINHPDVEACFWDMMEWWGCDKPVEFFNPYCYAIAFGTCIGCGGLFVGPPPPE